MPLMREPSSKAVIEVHPAWIARWPSDFEPVEAPKNRPSKKSTASPTGANGSREGEE
jgi:hypothetical protein